MRVEFAEHNRAGLFEARHGGCVLLGDMILEHARAGRAANPGGLIKILMANRYAMHRAAPFAASNFRLSLFGLGQRLVAAQGYEGIDFVVMRRNPRQVSLGCRHGGERFIVKSG